MSRREPVDYVDPLIDSAKPRIRWVFSVGTARPGGMVRPAANTDPVGTWNSGYRYESDTIACLSHMHSWQLSGVPVMPTTKKNSGSGFERYASRFSHAVETAEAGYYAVTLDGPGIGVELTATRRVGFHRYSFPASGPHAVVFDLARPLGPAAMSDAFVRLVGSAEIEGYVENDVTTRRNTRVRVYFVARFDRSIRRFDELRAADADGFGAYIELDTTREILLLKVAISLTGIDGARRNLEAELPGWDFDAVRDESRDEWNRALGRILVEGGAEEDRVKFYTDLFRVLSGPQTMSDVDGRYCHASNGTARILDTERDGSGRPAHPQLCGHDGFWNSQWSTNIVLGLAYPDVWRDQCRFLVDFYRDGGLIPRGPTAGSYSFVMIAAPTTPFITAAYMKGIRDFDMETAYEGMKRNTLPGGLMSKAGYEFDTCVGGGVEYYIERGYIPEGRAVEGAIHVDGASQTLEYAFQDWALAQLAAELGYRDDFETYSHRARNYRNLFDPQTGFMRPRRLDGSWFEPFDPLSLHDFCEANSWQYSFHVPHDGQSLITLMGGRDRFVRRLDEAFELSEPTDFYAAKPALERDRAYVNYGNEPGRFVAHLFAHAGAPWLTQKWSRLVKRKTFGSVSPMGFCEDDDIGKAAATSLLLSIGLFDVRGGASRDPVYELTAPVFEKVTIALGGRRRPGKTFVMEVAGNAAEHPYVRSVELNGKPLSRLWIFHRELAAGGTLRITVGAEPCRSMGTADRDLPPR